MRKCSRSRFVVAAGWMVLAIAPHALAGARDVGAQHRREGFLPYREILDHVVVVPVSLNGRGPFDLALDTAATFTTLDPDLAAELGLQPRGGVPVLTIAGARAVTRARLDRVQLGAVEVSGIDVVWADIAPLRAADRRVRGVLGQSTLARFSFGLDHARRLVVFHAPGRPDVVLPLQELEGRPAVRLSPKRPGHALSLVLDSGLSAPVLFEKEGAPLPVERVPGGFFRAETNSGDARLAMARLEGRIGGLRLDPVLAAIQDDRSAGGREEDGLLPTRLFRVVYFDREAGRILVRSR